MRIRESDSEVLEPGVDERLLAGRRAADPEAVRPEPVGPLDPAIRRPPDRRDVHPLPAHLLIALLLETSRQDAVVASYSGTAIAVSRSISHCRNVSSSAAWRSSQPSAVPAGRGS